MKSQPLIVVGIIIVLGVFGYLFFSNENFVPTLDEGGAVSNGQDKGLALDFTLENFEGGSVSLSEFRNDKPVIINFWAVWCPFCLVELKDFKKAAREYEDKIVILAVNRGESRSKTEEFSNEIGREQENLVWLLDPSDSMFRAYGGIAMPFTIFVSKEGKIVDQKLGPINLEEMRIKIKNNFNL